LGFRDIIVFCDNSVKIKKLKNCALNRVHKKLILWMRCVKWNVFSTILDGSMLFNFWKIYIDYFKWIFSIQTHKGLISLKTSFVLTLTPN
jgi:hypothetical protein